MCLLDLLRRRSYNRVRGRGIHGEELFAQQWRCNDFFAEKLDYEHTNSFAWI
jgi:hypothetical protein